MIQSISSNFDWYNNTNTNSTNKTNQGNEFLKLLNSTSSTEPNLNYLKLGQVSKQEVTSSIENIRNKMNEVIETARKEGKQELVSQLTFMRDFSYNIGVNAYNTTLNNLTEATDKISSLNPKELIKGVEKINNNLMIPHMALGGVAKIAEEFFKMAGVPYDLIQQDIDKIYKYALDSYEKIELNNGKVLMVKTATEMSKNLNSKYINMFENKKNSLLESLLQINNKDI